MAKCVSSLVDWKPLHNVTDQDFSLKEDLEHGEELLRKQLEAVNERIADIAHDYHLIANSSSSMEKFDYTVIQEHLVSKIKLLFSQSSSIVNEICSSKLPDVSCHRYFILYSSGIVANIQELLHIVGRLSELERNIFIEEQHKPFISEESITIHTLTLLWSGCIEILNSFVKPAEQLFKKYESGKFSFIDSLDFVAAGSKHSKHLLADLTITSWIQFNRFTRYEELSKGQPFLCYCHNKLYANILKYSSRNGTDLGTLRELLTVMKGSETRSANVTESSRHYSLLPQGDWTIEFDQAQVDYFIIWHIVSLHKMLEGEYLALVEACGDVMKNSFEAAMKQFFPTQTKPLMSPFQKEKFKLIFALLNYWCEKSKTPIPYIKMMLEFFNENWTKFGEQYFDTADLSIDGLTVFQLFTKLVNSVIPQYTKEGQAAEVQDKIDSVEKQDLYNVWNKLLTRIQPKSAPVATEILVGK